MLDWCEEQIERAARRVHFRLVVSVVHPELRRLEREADRAWAMWFAADAAPPWRRLASRLAVLGAGPLVGMVAAAAGAGLLGWSWLPMRLAALTGGAAGGYVLGGLLVEILRRGAARPRYFAAMRIFGHDVCPKCGYDLGGHELREIGQVRTCPECGAAVRSSLTDEARLNRAA